MSASPLPVLMVIANQDFYYKELNDTRSALLREGVDVVLAATSKSLATPHANSGQIEAGVSGIEMPDIALSDARSDDYSAIVFVGGWGSSMYQYAYNDPNGDGVTDNLYWNNAYNGDDNLQDGVVAPQKIVANNLINDFLAQDKQVAAICHGVTVLAWARVDGVSPLAGKQVAAPLTVGSPGQHYDGVDQSYPYYSGQHDQVADNGGFPSTASGIHGPRADASDDVVVDGKIITAENFDSATVFGLTIAHEVKASVNPVGQHAPILVQGQHATVPAGAPQGTVVFTATVTPDSASATFSIVDGNADGVFAMDPATGIVTVANAANLNAFAGKTVRIAIAAVNNVGMSTPAEVEVSILMPTVPAIQSGDTLVLFGTDAADVMYIWSNAGASVSAWINGTTYGPFAATHVQAFGGDGNDQIFATDLHVPVEIHGGGGHDLLIGGPADDHIDGGPGVDRVVGGPGNDVLLGGDGNDFLYGVDGNDVLVGGAGADVIEGGAGLDVLIGSTGGDRLDGGAGDDLLIGGATAFDDDLAMLTALRSSWIETANGGVWKTTNFNTTDIIVGPVGGHVKVFRGDSAALPTKTYAPTSARYLSDPLDGGVLYAIDATDAVVV